VHGKVSVERRDEGGGQGRERKKAKSKLTQPRARHADTSSATLVPLTPRHANLALQGRSCIIFICLYEDHVMQGIASCLRKGELPGLGEGAGLNGLHETITFAVAELVLNALFGADVALAVLLDILLAIFVGVTVGAAAVYGGMAALASDGIGAHVASNVQAANHGLEALGLKRVDETTLTNAP
jgi:hypothetical protein